LTALFFRKPDIHKMQEKRDVEDLIKALKYKDTDVRAEAAKALGKIGDVKATDSLVQAMKDENGYVRYMAVAALGKIGETKPVELFIQALKDEDYRVRWSAAEVLGRIGDARAVEPLIQVMKDESCDVRRYATEALRKFGLQYSPAPLMGKQPKFYFILHWPYVGLSEERRLQKETFEQLRKHAGARPFTMKVLHVEFVPREGLSSGLSMPKIVMVWHESEMPRIYAMGGIWGESSVIRKWVEESTGGSGYQDADLLGPRLGGLELLPDFKGVIDEFGARLDDWP